MIESPEMAVRVPRRGDSVLYPERDDMGESGLQLAVCQLLMGLLRSYFIAAGRVMLVGGNQFCYYREGDPRAKVAPDVYLIEDEDTPIEDVRSWKLWEHEGRAPALAVEVVSSEYRKDYDDEFLERYQALGVKELFRYDPERVLVLPRSRRTERRSLLTHFVRDESGALVVRPPQAPGRVKSALYDFWLVHLSPKTLRVGTGPLGEALWPSYEERAAAESERAAAEAERAARSEAEVERLRAELSEIRSGQKET